MRYLTLALLVTIATCSLLGCAGGGSPQIFGSPGPAAYQRQQAQRFDPYPTTDLGPSVSDARPRDFQNPPPEAGRGRWPQWGAPRYGY